MSCDVNFILIVCQVMVLGVGVSMKQFGLYHRVLEQPVWRGSSRVCLASFVWSGCFYVMVCYDEGQSEDGHRFIHDLSAGLGVSRIAVLPKDSALSLVIRFSAEPLGEGGHMSHMDLSAVDGLSSHQVSLLSLPSLHRVISCGDLRRECWMQVCGAVLCLG